MEDDHIIAAVAGAQGDFGLGLGGAVGALLGGMLFPFPGVLLGALVGIMVGEALKLEQLRRKRVLPNDRAIADRHDRPLEGSALSTETPTAKESPSQTFREQVVAQRSMRPTGGAISK